MSAPLANTTFDKTTPEKVWEGQGQPYWLSVNGGSVSGNVTVTGNETVTGVLTANSLVATTANATNLTVSGLTTLGVVTSGAINQGAVGFPSYGLGPSFSGTVISPLPVNSTSTCRFAMLCTTVTKDIPSFGYVSFAVNNDYAFAIGQSITVANTTNWNGNYQVYSVTPTSIVCATTNTSDSETGLSALIIPLYSAGVYEVSAICKVTQNTAPTAGSTSEGISLGLDVLVSAPPNFTQATVQATTNPIYTITGSYGQATFPVVGTVRVNAPLSSLWIVINTGAQTGSYNMTFRQMTVKPIGVFRA